MSEKKAPVNTRAQDPASALAEVIALGSEGFITRQESLGQASFVGSDTLPTRFNYPNEEIAKPILERWGVKFLGAVPSDPIFQYVELPPGWRKVATDHAMWSRLLDAEGRERASIFYKAAFYDRNAHLTLARRYNHAPDYKRRDAEKVAVSVVTDAGRPVYTTEPIPCDDARPWEASTAAEALAEKWLDEHYPQWRDHGAYW